MWSNFQERQIGDVFKGSIKQVDYWVDENIRLG